MADANLAIQYYAIAITVLLLLCNRLDRDWKSERGRTMTAMLWGNCILIASFLGAEYFDGEVRYIVLVEVLTSVKCGFAFVLAAFYTQYITQTVSDKNQIPRGLERLIYGMCIFALALNGVSIYNHMFFSCEGAVYARGPLLWLNQCLALVILLLDVLLIASCRKALARRAEIALTSYAVLPAFSAMIQLVLPPEFDAICVGTTLSLLIIYVTVHVERGRQLAEKEKELTESRMAVMLSQIQPHFLYNALAVIQNMCHGKAPEAEETTVEFAEFLRANLDSLSQREPIPFAQELHHTQNYLAIVHKRYGDALKVKYDIRATDFRIPALTLQPIVENAVRYGVMQREGGGTVRIGSSESEFDYSVTVTDDGVGFDVQEPKTDGRTHIGILNVRSRLEDMCGGSLSILSEKDRGTTAVILIPKEMSSETRPTAGQTAGLKW